MARLWGPVQRDELPAAVCSVLLKPNVSADLLKSVVALIPSELLPMPHDTKEKLLSRIRASNWLSPLCVLKNGNGRGGYTCLNTTSYRQPRRVHWSTPITPLHSDEDGDRVVGLLSYPTNNTRSKLDETCWMMPEPLLDLKRELHHASLPFLAPNSRVQEPNHCALCLYYTAFDSCMGRHRDNFVSEDLVYYLDTGDVSVLERETYSQSPNTSVMVWSMGNAPMVCELSYPASKANAGDRTTYIKHPDLCVPCGNGTLFIFNPTDDLFYCHEMRFLRATLDKMGPSGYRVAFIFRWLNSSIAANKTFYADGERAGHVKLTDETQKLEERRMKDNCEARLKRRIPFRDYINTRPQRKREPSQTPRYVDCTPPQDSNLVTYHRQHWIPTTPSIVDEINNVERTIIGVHADEVADLLNCGAPRLIHSTGVSLVGRQSSGGAGPRGASVILTTADSSSGPHADDTDSLLLNVSGTRSVWFAKPSAVKQDVMLRAKKHGGSVFLPSEHDPVLNPPRRGVEWEGPLVLGTGDAIRIARGWWHCVGSELEGVAVVLEIAHDSSLHKEPPCMFGHCGLPEPDGTCPDSHARSPLWACAGSVGRLFKCALRKPPA